MMDTAMSHTHLDLHAAYVESWLYHKLFAVRQCDRLMGKYFELNGRPYQHIVARGGLVTTNFQPCHCSSLATEMANHDLEANVTDRKQKNFKLFHCSTTMRMTVVLVHIQH